MDVTMQFTNNWPDLDPSDSTEVVTEPEDQDQLREHASAPEVIHIEDDKTPGRKESPEQCDDSRPVILSRPQLRGTRKRDYSYQEYETMMRNATQEPLPKRQKRQQRVTQRTADDASSRTPSIMDVISQGLRDWEDRAQAEINRLQSELDKQRAKADQLQSDKNNLQEENQRLHEIRVMKCQVCDGQPDRWRSFLCGHVFCEDCARRIMSPHSASCAICRQAITGYSIVYPFAG